MTGMRDRIFGPVLHEADDQWIELLTPVVGEAEVWGNPGVKPATGSILEIAPLTVNVDDLREFETKLRGKGFTTVDIRTRKPDELDIAQMGSPASMSEVVALSTFDRHQIQVSVTRDAGLGPGGGAATGDVVLCAGSPSFVLFANINETSCRDDLVDCVHTLSAQARRRFPANRAAIATVSAIGALVTALFVLACVAMAHIRFAPLLIVVGVVLVMSFPASLIRWHQWLRAVLRKRGGTRIDTVSRTELLEGRRNAGRDLKVGIGVGVVVALVTALITIWLS